MKDPLVRLWLVCELEHGFDYANRVRELAVGEPNRSTACVFHGETVGFGEPLGDGVDAGTGVWKASDGNVVNSARDSVGFDTS
jgi:hypothetical protein